MSLIDENAAAETPLFDLAPGSVVVVRDEEWLVTGVRNTGDGQLIEVQGLSELVRETDAIFSGALDKITILDPTQAEIVADPTPGFRRTRLWLEAMLRKSSTPLTAPELTVATQGLADELGYQQAAVRQALDPTNLRPRILLADAVGLGKTLEIGMILSELVRRGRGDRILIVTPRHVLEQMQFELWTRFALPFVRLDSVGIQRIRQKLPASRNPFTYFKRVIVSIDTLKSDRYLGYLEKQFWDAVVIDESHNVTNTAAQNNRLARLLARQSDGLVLASATPHNGKAESFAELIRLLEPSAVRPDGTLVEDEVRRLIIRRHRNSPGVASVVGNDWAERLEPDNRLVGANAAEDAIARELETIWLFPENGVNPYSGKNSKLFPWTLAKAFLSSPAALQTSIRERLRRLGDDDNFAVVRERTALEHLAELAEVALASRSSKLDALVDYLAEIGVGRRSATRAVVFAERVATLSWLREHLLTATDLPADAIRILHGGLSDVEQQEIVESFKQESSPIRLLVTGDVASEGVNLHSQCHHVIHFDIPWSLIRIEQRNGRIDRYGQRHSPQITTLLLDPSSERFAGDVRVLRKLMEKEHEAHTALGDPASIMGRYDVDAEEEEIRKVLAGERDVDDVLRSVDEVVEGGGIEGLLARLADAQAADQPRETAPAPRAAATSGLFEDDLAFLRDALEEVYETPGMRAPNGVGWAEHPRHAVVEFEPPADLRRRLEVLPQSYLRERSVTRSFKLATTQQKGRAALADALSDESDSLWPEAHYLAPLHPVLDWAADRALGALGRNQVFAVVGDVPGPTVLVHGALTNRNGQVVSSTYLTVRFPNPRKLTFAPVTPHGTAYDALTYVGLTKDSVNTNPQIDVDALRVVLPPAVGAARAAMREVVAAAAADTDARVERWRERTEAWTHDAEQLTLYTGLEHRKRDVSRERDLAAGLLPDRTLVRPLLVVIPDGFDIDSSTGGR